MNKIFLTFSIFIMLSSCFADRSTKLYFDYSKLDTIKIIFQGVDKADLIINDKSEIQNLGKVLNDNYHEPLKFLPRYRVELIQGKNKEVIYCTTDAVMYNGVTYRLGGQLNLSN